MSERRARARRRAARLERALYGVPEPERLPGGSTLTPAGRRRLLALGIGLSKLPKDRRRLAVIVASSRPSRTAGPT